MKKTLAYSEEEQQDAWGAYHRGMISGAELFRYLKEAQKHNRINIKEQNYE